MNKDQAYEAAANLVRAMGGHPFAAVTVLDNGKPIQKECRVAVAEELEAMGVLKITGGAAETKGHK